MQFKEMSKRVDGKDIVVVGMISKEEAQQYKNEGYKTVVSNKHGIPTGK